MTLLSGSRVKKMKTEIINLSNETSFEERMNYAAKVIKEGGLVVFPTETVYGLGADATNAEAAKKIYSAKGRPSDNPLIIHVASPLETEKYAYTNELYYKLADRFMPGPLTVVLKSKSSIPKETRGGLDTVAVRCPSNSIANTLIKLSGVPIAAPSANLSGSPSPTLAKHVIDDLFGRVDIIIDGGDSDFGLESTIVSLVDERTPVLLRPGKITPQDIIEVTGSLKIADAVTDKLKEGEKALSPGMKYRHYAPKAELILLDGKPENNIQFILSAKEKRSIAIIAYNEEIDFYKKELNNATFYDFGEKSNEELQAHNLFSILREIDKLNFNIVYAPLPRKDGVGLALYNRMIRAAAHKIVKT